MVLVYRPLWWRKFNGSVAVKVAVAVVDLFFVGHIKCSLISKCPKFPDTRCRHDLRVLSSSYGLGWLAFKLKHNAKCALCFQSRGLWAAGVWLLGTFMSETAPSPCIPCLASAATNSLDRCRSSWNISQRSRLGKILHERKLTGLNSRKWQYGGYATKPRVSVRVNVAI